MKIFVFNGGDYSISHTGFLICMVFYKALVQELSLSPPPSAWKRCPAVRLGGVRTWSSLYVGPRSLEGQEGCCSCLLGHATDLVLGLKS